MQRGQSGKKMIHFNFQLSQGLKVESHQPPAKSDWTSLFLTKKRRGTVSQIEILIEASNDPTSSLYLS